MERKVFPKLCPKFNTSMPLSAADVNRIWWLGSWLVFRVTFKIPEVEEDDLDDHDCQGGRWPTPGGLNSRRRTGKFKNSFFSTNVKIFRQFQLGKNIVDYQNQAKRLFKTLTATSPIKCSIESNDYLFHYIIEQDACFLTLCDRNFNKKLAYSFLEDLSQEFYSQYGHKINTATRPYSFIEFGKFKNSWKWMTTVLWQVFLNFTKKTKILIFTSN